MLLIASATGLTKKTPTPTQQKMLEEVEQELERPIAGTHVLHCSIAAHVLDPDDRTHVAESLETLYAASCEVTRIQHPGDYSLFRHLLIKADWMYIEGGNPSYLMWWLSKHGLNLLLKARLQAGLPYIGSSAGAMILGRSLHASFKAQDSTYRPRLLQREARLNGLGLIKGSIIPHVEPSSKDAQTIRKLAPLLRPLTGPILPLADGQYLTFHE